MRPWFRHSGAFAASPAPHAGPAERLARGLFLLAVFSVPFSTALTNLFVGLTLIAFVLALVRDRSLGQALRSLPALLALALLGMILLGSLWTIAPPSDLQNALRKYSKLLVLPVALCLCWRAPSLPGRALHWSLAGCGVLATAVYLTWLHLMPTSDLGWWRVGDAGDPYAFRNHITIGILLAFASCACFLIATYRTELRARLAALAAGVYFAAPIVLLGQGRTGYVALFIGLFTLYLLRARVTVLRTAGVALALVAMFISFYFVSSNFHARTNALVTEVTNNVEASPNGMRMSFMRVGISAVAARPLLGHGTGSFAEIYEPEGRRIWAGNEEMSNMRYQPHSEPVMLAVQLGMVGVVLFAALLGTIVRAALARRHLLADTLTLLVAVYGTTSLFNSLLWDPTEAYWFLLLAGALYAYCIAQRNTSHPTSPTVPARQSSPVS